MAEKASVLVLDARFYGDIADRLVASAASVLEAESVAYERISVPGAFELPAALAMAHHLRPHEGYVALGCVIRGETSHYDHVCRECAHGLASLATAHRLALGFGVITAENREQAVERASAEGRDVGGAAARACLAMLAVRGRLASPQPL